VFLLRAQEGDPLLDALVLFDGLRVGRAESLDASAQAARLVFERLDGQLRERMLQPAGALRIGQAVGSQSIGRRRRVAAFAVAEQRRADGDDRRGGGLVAVVAVAAGEEIVVRAGRGSGFAFGALLGQV